MGFSWTVFISGIIVGIVLVALVLLFIMIANWLKDEIHYMRNEIEMYNQIKRDKEYQELKAENNELFKPK